MDWSIARAISDNGLVVGSSGRREGNVERAFIWTEANGMRDLGALSTTKGSGSGAYGVNFSGKVVGVSWDGATAHAVIFP